MKVRYIIIVYYILFPLKSHSCPRSSCETIKYENSACFSPRLNWMMERSSRCVDCVAKWNIVRRVIYNCTIKYIKVNYVIKKGFFYWKYFDAHIFRTSEHESPALAARWQECSARWGPEIHRFHPVAAETHHLGSPWVGQTLLNFRCFGWACPVAKRLGYEIYHDEPGHKTAEGLIH